MVSLDLSSNLWSLRYWQSMLSPTGEITCWRAEAMGPTGTYMSSTYTSLYGNGLHTTSKDSSPHTYLPNMGYKALESQGNNSISSLQKTSQNQGIQVSSPRLHKHQTLTFLRYVLTLAFLSYWRSFYHWLNL